MREHVTSGVFLVMARDPRRRPNSQESTSERSETSSRVVEYLYGNSCAAIVCMSLVRL